MPERLNVLFLSAEADPFVKVGGLGDVAGSLPAALRDLEAEVEVDVRVVLPLHGGVDRDSLGLKPVAALTIYHANGMLIAEALRTEHEGVPIYFISGPLIPQEGPVYSSDAQADGRKYAFFSLAALELARVLEWQPDVLHANDWHTALAVYWVALNRDDDYFQDTATLLEVHNLPYLGAGAELALKGFGLPPAEETDLPPWARGLPLPLGLMSADHIVTVSPGYAREILTPEFGSGLEAFLASRADSVSGILNGIDLARWDPATDPHLEANYTRASLPMRAQNKEALQAEFGLEASAETPLLGMVTRMDHQKGVDLALEALRRVGDLEWQAVILGTGDPDLEAAARQLEADLPDRVRAVIGFDPRLARRIYAGADAVLIPSRYEPCGLAQMIAMRYGSVPIGRATGGLRDTIQDYHESDGGTGFLFSEAEAGALENALRRAVEVYHDKRRWPWLQRRGMQQDFSWERSARKYLDLYRSLVRSRQSERSA